MKLLVRNFGSLLLRTKNMMSYEKKKQHCKTDTFFVSLSI